jgi:hypothetical protein
VAHATAPSEDVRARLAAGILKLQGRDQARALAAARVLFEQNAPRATLGPHLAYLGRPHDYIREILGRDLIPQQVRIIDAAMEHRRGIFPGGTNLCKSDALSALAIYFLDVEGAVPEAMEGGAPRGCRIVLAGPTHPSIFNFYEKMLRHAERAEKRGHRMPGERSAASVLWRIGPDWGVEPVSPPRSAGETVAHAMSGRHAGVMFLVIEEAQGTREAIWASAEGMLSGEDNYLLAPLNPTESTGPAYDRVRDGRYVAVHLSAFDHPNILNRDNSIKAAVSYQAIDARVRGCEDRGSWPAEQPNPTFAEFLYALPPAGAQERGGRDDGIPGHPDGEVRVYRPRGLFEGQVLGQFPVNISSGLIRASTWDAAVERWRRRRDPDRKPDAVGVDPAREGADTTKAAPRWGPSAETMLRDYGEAQAAADPKRMADLQGDDRRIRVGELVSAPPGDGPEVAGFLWRRFPWKDVPWYVDEGSVGASPLDHARRVIGVDARPVAFGGERPPIVPGEPWCANVRTALYVRAMMLLERDLVDPPDDPELRKEMLAHELMEEELTVIDQGRKRRASGVRVLAKDEVKKKLGRSPDRADAFVLALWHAAPAAPHRAGVARLPLGYARR